MHPATLPTCCFRSCRLKKENRTALLAPAQTQSNTDAHHSLALNTVGSLCCACPDITSLTQFPGCHAAQLGHSKVSSHSVSADGIVLKHNFHCIWSRRGWKSLLQQTPGCFVLNDPHQQSRVRCRSSRLLPPTPSTPHPPLLSSTPPTSVYWEVKPGFPRFHSP